MDVPDLHKRTAQVYFDGLAGIQSFDLLAWLAKKYRVDVGAALSLESFEHPEFCPQLLLFATPEQRLTSARFALRLVFSGDVQLSYASRSPVVLALPLLAHARAVQVFQALDLYEEEVCELMGLMREFCTGALRGNPHGVDPATCVANAELLMRDVLAQARPRPVDPLYELFRAKRAAGS